MLLVTGMSAMADDVADNRGRMLSPERIEFAPYWSLRLQAGIAETLGETSFSDMLSPAAALSAGYHFAPAWSVRLGVSGWQAKGAWVSPRRVYKYDFIQGNADIVMSLSNIIGGFRPDRRVDFYAFLGVGVINAFNNDEAANGLEYADQLKYLWTGHKWFVAGRAGVGADINLSRYVAFNVEVNANMMSDRFNSKRGGSVDWQFNALAGFTFKFGKGTRKVPAVYEELPPAPVAAAPVKEEPKVTPKPVEQPKPEVKVEKITENIFFLINSSKIIASQEGKVAAVVDYMKRNPGATVVVTGYADKATGTSRYNKTLSDRRAKAVGDALLDAGISADRISMSGKGDSEQPFVQNDDNRVVIMIAE